MRTIIAIIVLCSSIHAGEIADALARQSKKQAHGIHLPLTGDDYWPEDRNPSTAATTPQPQAVEPPSQPVVQTTVCQCRGYREHLCLCLKAGQKCHCSRTSGSVWERESESAAWVKTTRKADPSQKAASTPAPANPPPAGEGIPVEILPDGRGRWLHPTLGWRWSTGPMQKGLRYLDLLYGDDGKMHQTGAKMAVQLPQQSGYWKKVCHGTWCEMIWVPN